MTISLSHYPACAIPMGAEILIQYRDCPAKRPISAQRRQERKEPQNDGQPDLTSARSRRVRDPAPSSPVHEAADHGKRLGRAEAGAPGDFYTALGRGGKRP